MKKIICIALAAMALILAGSTSGEARRGHGHHGGHFSVGVFAGPVWGPGWGYPYYPSYPYQPYYPYYSGPPVVVQQEPETYIQRDSQDEEQIYWYFCKDPEGYYPYVKNCPKGWLKVMPDTTPEGEEE